MRSFRFPSPAALVAAFLLAGCGTSPTEPGELPRLHPRPTYPRLAVTDSNCYPAPYFRVTNQGGPMREPGTWSMARDRVPQGTPTPISLQADSWLVIGSAVSGGRYTLRVTVPDAPALTATLDCTGTSLDRQGRTP
jgi:hypothetical protein